MEKESLGDWQIYVPKVLLRQSLKLQNPDKEGSQDYISGNLSIILDSTIKYCDHSLEFFGS